MATKIMMNKRKGLIFQNVYSQRRLRSHGQLSYAIGHATTILLLIIINQFSNHQEQAKFN